MGSPCPSLDPSLWLHQDPHHPCALPRGSQPGMTHGLLDPYPHTGIAPSYMRLVKTPWGKVSHTMSSFPPVIIAGEASSAGIHVLETRGWWWRNCRKGQGMANPGRLGTWGWPQAPRNILGVFTQSTPVLGVGWHLLKRQTATGTAL